MKLAVPLTVAGFVAEKVLPPRFRTTVIALVIVLIPAVLIVQQPDLGTGILVAASGLFVLFFGRGQVALYSQQHVTGLNCRAVRMVFNCMIISSAVS